MGSTGRAPSSFDTTLTKGVTVGRYKLEARLEAYNALNSIVWDNPDISIVVELRQVTRKRTMASAARSSSASASASNPPFTPRETAWSPGPFSPDG